MLVVCGAGGAGAGGRGGEGYAVEVWKRVGKGRSDGRGVMEAWVGGSSFGKEGVVKCLVALRGDGGGRGRDRRGGGEEKCTRRYLHWQHWVGRLQG